MRFGERHRAGVEVAEWLNGTEFEKVVAVDVFDGTYPAMTLTGGAYLDNSTGMVRPQVASNFARVSDSAALSITGDLDIMCRLKMDDWSPAGQTYIVTKGSGGAASSYHLGISGFGNKTLQFYASANGTTNSISAVESTAYIPFNDGDYGWVRATLDVDNGAGSYQLKFYTAADESGIPTSWTQLGVTRTGTATSIFDGTGELRMMEFVPSSASVLRRLVIKDGYDGAGSTVFDADFSVPAYGAKSFTESSANAATVYINSTASWTAPWTLPAGATWVRVLCVGGGGSSGSGRKGALLTQRNGGSSGGTGGVSFAEFSASAFSSSVTVNVGIGGTGGMPQVNNSSHGVMGNPGVATTFGAFCGAGGGGAGVGGATGTSGTNAPGNPGLGLYGYIGNANAGRTLPGTTFIVAPGSGGAGFFNNNTVSIALPGTSGMAIGGDVPAIRNFSGGSAGATSDTGNAISGTNGQSGCSGGGGGASVDNVGNSGAGGNGGDGFCVVVSYRDVDIQEFTASGTWNKPVGDYSLAKIFVVGAGGGGGSGRRGAASTTRTAGGAGGGGAITCITVPLSQLGATETVTVGLGGTGGASITVDNTDGNPGTSGGQSSLGSVAVADGGLNGGAGNATTSGSGGLIRNGFSFNGGNGPASQNGGGTGTAGAGLNSYTGGGGSGGGISASNNLAGVGVGGVGAAYTSAITAAQPGGVNWGDPGQNGPNVATVPGFYGGNGGAGGSPGNAGNSGKGGNGSAKGGGGGGGGASANTYTSGAGGNGGDGYVCVVCV